MAATAGAGTWQDGWLVGLAYLWLAKPSSCGMSSSLRAASKRTALAAKAVEAILQLLLHSVAFRLEPLSR